MQIVLELVILITLLCTIWFCWRLHNRIIELKGNRKEIMTLIQTFDTALVTTHRSITELKETTATASSTLKTQIQKSEEILNDLYFIVDIGEKLASKLDKHVINAKNAVLSIEQSFATKNAEAEIYEEYMVRKLGKTQNLGPAKTKNRAAKINTNPSNRGSKKATILQNRKDNSKQKQKITAPKGKNVMKDNVSKK